jgi:ubiquinone/menaquinone biosynthesis C-methylase UbiE
MMSRSLSALWDRRVDAVLSGHYGCPSGLLGRVAGERMVRQHAVETEWTVSLLGLAAEERVLEIGCGAGRGLELAGRQVASGQVVGVDLSAVMVRAARRRNARAVRAGSVVVEQGDVTRLPFEEHQFDKLFSIHSVYFWPDRARALAELRRVLKPGGRLALTVTTGKAGDVSPGADYFRKLLDEQLLPEMEQAGFQAVSVAQGPNSRGWQIAAAVGLAA